MAGRLGGMSSLLLRPWTVVGSTLRAALLVVWLGEDDLGGGGTDDSGVDAEETVKALSDVVNGLDGSWRKTSIPCSNIQGLRMSGSQVCFVWSQLATSRLATSRFFSNSGSDLNFHSPPIVFSQSALVR
jgi:hypothetical protein